MKKLPPDTTVFKSVGWSYPTSSNAKKFGFQKTGCWTVSREYSHDTKSIPPDALAGFASREEALAAARKMELPWSWSFSQIHPEDAKIVRAA